MSTLTKDNPAQSQGCDPACSAIRTTRSLVILGCSSRKRSESHLLPAIERYDGPLFRVLRRHLRDAPEQSVATCILSGRFGLIRGDTLLPEYDQRLKIHGLNDLGPEVEGQIRTNLQAIRPARVFASLGCRYWGLIEGPLHRQLPDKNLFVATGGIGGRASQLVRWLQMEQRSKAPDVSTKQGPGEAKLLGTVVRLSRDEVIREAERAMAKSPAGAHRFETWYVPIGSERVAPKWLVSLIFHKPVSRFRTSDAKRVLSMFGVECVYDDSH
jgi:hypothetical protein